MSLGTVVVDETLVFRIRSIQFTGGMVVVLATMWGPVPDRPAGDAQCVFLGDDQVEIARVRVGISAWAGVVEGVDLTVDFRWAMDSLVRTSKGPGW